MEGRKEMCYIMMHSTHFILQLYGRKEGNVLFNDALSTFYFTVIWKEGRKEMFYSMMHSTHFISQLYGRKEGRKEGRKCFIQ